VSPRRANPQTRSALLETAARLLTEEGPAALSTRRLANLLGTSTTAVYTYFDGMDDLVRAMVYEGFARLHDRLRRVRRTADPVADLAMLGRAYRGNALSHPHLYGAMFGGSSLGGFSLTEEDRQHGRYTFGVVIDTAGRCIDAGRFSPADPHLIAHHMWIGMHGLVTLELGGYLVEPYDASLCFESQLEALFVGAGDAPATAEASVARSRRRAARRLSSARAAESGALDIGSSQP
jgi:AcrR family transcriptional regulator